MKAYLVVMKNRREIVQLGLAFTSKVSRRHCCRLTMPS